MSHKRRLLDQAGEGNDGDQFLTGRARRVLGEPHAWWLATRAPLAVGARDPRKVIDDEARATLLDSSGSFQWTPDDEAETLTQARTAAQAALAKAQRARQAMLDAEHDCANKLAELAEEAEAAWAWATTMQCRAALLEATDTQRPERQRAVERSYAEWITAAARAATGSGAEAVATWARSLPEHAEAREGNAEGAGAAADADARSPAKRFRPSARAECFLGTLSPPGTDGRRHMVPSLELTESQRRGTRTLPADMAPPTAHDARKDPRVAWTDGSRVWAETPQRLHWSLTDEQRAHITRQREAALRRRAAPPMRPGRDAQVIVGPAAAEAERPLESETRHLHGVNHAQQTQAETIAAEERADIAAGGDGPCAEWHVLWGDAEIEEAEREAAHAARHDEDPMAEAWEATLTAEHAALASEFDELEHIADAFHGAGRPRATDASTRDAYRHCPPPSTPDSRYAWRSSACSRANADTAARRNDRGRTSTP